MHVKRSRARAGDRVAQVLDLKSSTHTFLQVDGEAMETADMAEMYLVRL